MSIPEETQKTMRTKCKIDYCQNEIKYKAAELCAACYSRNRYWGNKTPTERMERAYRLAVYAAQMRSMDPGVVDLKARRRRR